MPRERFERDERAALGPLAPRPYHSLVLAPERIVRSTPVALPLALTTALPAVHVERRPLAAYARLARLTEVGR